MSEHSEQPKKRKNNKKKPNKTSYCSNCGNYGHQFKQCHDAITSFGVINVQVNVEGIDDEKLEKMLVRHQETSGINLEDPRALQAFCLLKDKVRFLLIRRRNTLGFLEFMRGHYRVDNVDGIVFLFRQMTPEEIKKIGRMTFDELWYDLWNTSEKIGHEHQYELSKRKFEQLTEDDELLNLNFYVKNVTPSYSIPEWGFPKGRRNFRESDLDCAAREFEEETGQQMDDYSILKQIQPVDEEFIGTNGVRYKHVYYLSYSHNPDDLKIDQTNAHQANEIGDIGWFTYDETMQMIRPYHTERKKLLTKLYVLLQNSLVEYFLENSTSSEEGV